MKCSITLTLALAVASLQTIGQEALPSAQTIIEDACRQAAKENKKVFVIFHASWCPWCRKLDTTLNSPEVKPLFDSQYITRHMVVLESAPRKHLETPGGKHFLDDQVPNYGGIPAWIIVDANGKTLTDSRLRIPGTDSIGINTGCPATRKEIDYFISCLKNTSTLTHPELLVIGRAFARLRQIAYE